jgi:hypothetical protein
MHTLGCVSCVCFKVIERQGKATKRGRAYRAVKHAATFVDLELAWSKQFPILCTPVEIASCHVLPWGYNTRPVKCIETKRAGKSTLSPSRHASARTGGDDGVHHAIMSKKNTSLEMYLHVKRVQSLRAPREGPSGMQRALGTPKPHLASS